MDGNTFCRVFICCFVLVLNGATSKTTALTVSDYEDPVDPWCLDCICDAVSDCSLEALCVAGDACGPYRITYTYWRDAGRPVVAPGDDPDHEDAFVDCAVDRRCSIRVVQAFMDRNKKDCNGDGTVDCKDFYALHILGADCNVTLHQNYLKKYEMCDLPYTTNYPANEDISQQCLDCLCEASSHCNPDKGCAGEVCGLFQITWDYWADAGMFTQSGDDPMDAQAFSNCVTEPICAARTVQGYMAKFRQDCNGDGLVDCKDFFALHILGAGCNSTLHENFLEKYDVCDQPDKVVPALKEETNLFLPNYETKCARCLCEAASGCNNNTVECDDVFCGIYKLSRPYWTDAGRPVIPGDDPDRKTAFEDCALDTECAERTVKKYLGKFGRDCNGNHVTNCADYLMIHFSDNSQCSSSVDREWVNRYHDCWLRLGTEIPNEDGV